MAPNPNQPIHFYIVPQTWYGRLLAAAAGVLLLLLVIFFFTLFLVVFGVMAVAAAVYLVLFGRRTEARPFGNAIRIEYSSVDSEDEPEEPAPRQDHPDN